LCGLLSGGEALPLSTFPAESRNRPRSVSAAGFGRMTLKTLPILQGFRPNGSQASVRQDGARQEEHAEQCQRDRKDRKVPWQVQRGLGQVETAEAERD
jgi:hypothetical protein